MTEKISRRHFLAVNSQRLAVSAICAQMFIFSGCQAPMLSKLPRNSPDLILRRLLPNIDQIHITSGYGYRQHPVTGLKQWHQGIDIALAPGTAIHAPGWGFVDEVFVHPKGGLSMRFLDLTNRVTWGLAHLKNVTTDEGLECYVGAPLAVSGGERGHPNSGNSIGPHLHLTARVNNRLVDPAKVLGL